MESAASQPSLVAMARDKGFAADGLGLYRVIDAGERAGDVLAHLAARDIRVRAYPGGRLAVIPELDRAVAAAGALRRALEEL